MPPKRKSSMSKAVAKKADRIVPDDVITLDDDDEEDGDDIQIVKHVRPKKRKKSTIQKTTAQCSSTLKDENLDETENNVAPSATDASKSDRKVAKDDIKESAESLEKGRKPVDVPSTGETSTTIGRVESVGAVVQTLPSMTTKKRVPVVSTDHLKATTEKTADRATALTPKNSLTRSNVESNKEIDSSITPRTSTTTAGSARRVGVESAGVNNVHRESVVPQEKKTSEGRSEKKTAMVNGSGQKTGESHHGRISAVPPIADTHPTPSSNVALSETVRCARAGESGKKNENEKKTETAKGRGMGQMGRETGMKESATNTLPITPRDEPRESRKKEDLPASKSVQKVPHRNTEGHGNSIPNGTTGATRTVNAPLFVAHPSVGTVVNQIPSAPTEVAARRGRPPKTVIMQRVVIEESHAPKALPPPSNRDFVPNAPKSVHPNQNTPTAVNGSHRVTRSSSRFVRPAPFAPLPPPPTTTSPTGAVIMGATPAPAAVAPREKKKPTGYYLTKTTTTIEEAPLPPTTTMANGVVTLQIDPRVPRIFVYRIHKNYHDLHSMEAYFCRFPGFDCITLSCGPNSPTAKGVLTFTTQEGHRAVMDKGHVHIINGHPLYTSSTPETDERTIQLAIGATEHERKRAAEGWERRTATRSIGPPNAKRLKSSETIIPTDMQCGVNKPVDPRRRGSVTGIKDVPLPSFAMELQKQMKKKREEEEGRRRQCDQTEHLHHVPPHLSVHRHQQPVDASHAHMPPRGRMGSSPPRGRMNSRPRNGRMDSPPSPRERMRSPPISPPRVPRRFPMSVNPPVQQMQPVHQQLVPTSSHGMMNPPRRFSQSAYPPPCWIFSNPSNNQISLTPPPPPSPPRRRLPLPRPPTPPRPATNEEWRAQQVSDALRRIHARDHQQF